MDFFRGFRGTNGAHIGGGVGDFYILSLVVQTSLCLAISSGKRSGRALVKRHRWRRRLRTKFPAHKFLPWCEVRLVEYLV